MPNERVAAMFTARRLLIALISIVLTGVVTHAQVAGHDPRREGVVLALTYDTLGSNITTSNRFWLQGGAAELTGSFFHGFGATASVLGLHTANNGGGVPVNLVVATFGPSYTYTHHRVGLFAHGLLGEANGFAGVYPQTGGASSSANSLAMQAGGGLDLSLSRHMALRVIQADYLRTQLPNSQTNVQNSLRLGIGIVLR